LQKDLRADTESSWVTGLPPTEATIDRDAGFESLDADWEDISDDAVGQLVSLRRHVRHCAHDARNLLAVQIATVRLLASTEDDAERASELRGCLNAQVGEMLEVINRLDVDRPASSAHEASEPSSRQQDD
jgi:hypothetical protein